MKRHMRVTTTDIITAAGLIKHALRGAPYTVLIEAVHQADDDRSQAVIAALSLMAGELAMHAEKTVNIPADKLMDGVIQRALKGRIGFGSDADDG